jgi:hypothetical protein
VHYSLTDVQLYEIPLCANQRIYSKLMSRRECNDAVMANIYAGGYVCQGQQIMEATVEYDLRVHGDTSGSASAEAGEIANAIKVTAHRTRMFNSPRERAGWPRRTHGSDCVVLP